jgi:hypothetical protein
VLSEDAHTEYLDCLLLSNGFVAGQYEIWSYNGCSKRDSVLAICAFLEDHAPGVKLLIHRDRDFQNEEDINSYVKAISKIDPNIMNYFTSGTDIESDFINPSHIVKCVKGITKKDADALIVAATEASKARSIRNLISYKSDKSVERQRSSDGKYRHNAGDVSAESHALYNGNPQRYRIGKDTIGPLKNLLQKQIGGEINLLQPNDTLVSKTLKSFRKFI